MTEFNIVEVQVYNIVNTRLHHQLLMDTHDQCTSPSQFDTTLSCMQETGPHVTYQIRVLCNCIQSGRLQPCSCAS